MVLEINGADLKTVGLAGTSGVLAGMTNGDATEFAYAPDERAPLKAQTHKAEAVKRHAPTDAQRPAASVRPRPQKTAAHTTVKAKKTLGSVLRTRRHALQMTQREIAAKLGVKPAHIAYLELDHRRLSLSLLNRIADVLDLERERLILLSHPEARSFISGPKQTTEVPAKDQAWRDFKRNKGVLNRYKVSKKELQVLSQVALLGHVATPRSYLFILNSIRQAVDDEEV